MIIERCKEFVNAMFPEVVETPAEIEVAKIELAQSTLEDGTVIEYANIAVDEPIFQVTPEGNIPLADGDYLIEENTVTVLGGIITAVAEIEKPEIEIEVPIMAEELTIEEIDALIEGKVEEVKLAYEAKFNAQKAEFEARIEALGAKFNETIVIQAPVEAEQKPLTLKDRLISDIQSKRNKNNF